MTQKKLVVSVINYRTGPLTIACVDSVLADLGDLDAQVVIVDNLSNDGSAEQIENWLAERPDAPVHFVRSPTNSGFSGGHNHGIAAVKADYYLVLNSDALVRRGFFENLMKVADANPRAGLIAPRIDYDDGTPQRSRFRFHSPQSELIRAASTAQVTALLKPYVIAPDSFESADKVQWASFACILLRGDMITDIGPMDEGYFLYFEDCEYCFRARRKGWTIALADTAIAIHFRGGSGPVKSLEKERKRLPEYYYASRTRFFRQAYGPLGPVLGNLAWHLGRLIAQTRRIFAKPVPQTVQKEARDIWTNAGDPLKPQHQSEASRA